MGYDNYGFVLQWDDLPEDLREEKITQALDHAVANDPYGYWERFSDDLSVGSDVRDLDKTGDTMEANSPQARALASILMDHQLLRDEVADDLAVHFPVYF